MTPEAIKSFLRAVALVCLSVGAFGSIICIPYALTNSLDLILVSGIYFVAGAVMITGGLTTYTILVKDTK